jgi:hypothetical protein
MTNHEELFISLKKSLAAFFNSTEVDNETLKEQLEELRDNISDHISLINEEEGEEGEYEEEDEAEEEDDK